MLTNNSIKVNDRLIHSTLGEVTVTGSPQREDSRGEWGVYVQDSKKEKIHYVKTADLKRA